MDSPYVVTVAADVQRLNAGLRGSGEVTVRVLGGFCYSVMLLYTVKVGTITSMCQNGPRRACSSGVSIPPLLVAVPHSATQPRCTKSPDYPSTSTCQDGPPRACFNVALPPPPSAVLPHSAAQSLCTESPDCPST